MTPQFHIPKLFGVSSEVYLILIIIGVPTFFFWRWLIKKHVRTNNWRIVLTWTSTIVATPAIYLILVGLFFFGMSYHPNREFNKQKWIEDKETRYELSDDIIKSKILIGKTKLEVRNILGEEGNIDQSDDWGYYLGFKPGFANIDPCVLIIKFRDGKVIYVAQHET